MKWLPKSQTNASRSMTTKYQAVTVEYAANNGTAAAIYWMKVEKSGIGDRKSLLYKKLYAEWPIHLLKSNGECMKSNEGCELQIDLIARPISASHSHFIWDAAVAYR